MITIRTTFRRILTGSLLLSLSIASLPPRLVASQCPAAATSRTDSDSRCCSNPTGRCCGMLCCAMPLKKEATYPPTTRPSEDRSPPLGLAIFVKSLTGHGLCPAFHGDPVSGDASDAASASLIALSIRLNI